MSKKNLDGILLKNEKILPPKDESFFLSAKQRGRTRKAAHECDSEVISIKITPLELAIIKEKAGELVPKGAFVKHYLRTKTDLFTQSKSDEQEK